MSAEQINNNEQNSTSNQQDIYNNSKQYLESLKKIEQDNKLTWADKAETEKIIQLYDTIKENLKSSTKELVNDMLDEGFSVNNKEEYNLIKGLATKVNPDWKMPNYEEIDTVTLPGSRNVRTNAGPNTFTINLNGDILNIAPYEPTWSNWASRQWYIDIWSGEYIKNRDFFFNKDIYQWNNEFDIDKKKYSHYQQPRKPKYDFDIGEPPITDNTVDDNQWIDSTNWEPGVNETSEALNESQKYTVKSGDTYVTAIRNNLITQISELNDVSVKDILNMKHHGIDNINKIYPGDTIQLKKIDGEWEVFVEQKDRPVKKPDIEKVDNNSENIPNKEQVTKYIKGQLPDNCTCEITIEQNIYTCNLNNKIDKESFDFDITYDNTDNFYKNLNKNIQKFLDKLDNTEPNITTIDDIDSLDDNELHNKLEKVAEKGGKEVLYSFENEEGNEVQIIARKNSKNQVWIKLDTPKWDGMMDKFDFLASAWDNMPNLKSIKETMQKWVDNYQEKDAKFQEKRDAKNKKKKEKQDKREEDRNQRKEEKLKEASEKTGLSQKEIALLNDKNITLKRVKRNGDIIFNRKGFNDIIISKDQKTITDEQNKLGDLSLENTSRKFSEVVIIIDAYLKARFETKRADRVWKNIATKIVQWIIDSKKEVPADEQIKIDDYILRYS